MLYASLGNGREFKNGRHASVYVGLRSKQHSSEGRCIWLGLTKKEAIKN